LEFKLPAIIRPVAPLAGAWIETRYCPFIQLYRVIVAPLAGAWIETVKLG